jgi:hypothetical protein
MSGEEKRRLDHRSSGLALEWIGCGVAVAGTMVAVLLRWGLESMVGPGLPVYTTFYLVIICSALLGGTRAKIAR